MKVRMDSGARLEIVDIHGAGFSENGCQRRAIVADQALAQFAILAATGITADIIVSRKDGPGG